MATDPVIDDTTVRTMVDAAPSSAATSTGAAVPVAVPKLSDGTTPFEKFKVRNAAPAVAPPPRTTSAQVKYVPTVRAAMAKPSIGTDYTQRKVGTTGPAWTPPTDTWKKAVVPVAPQAMVNPTAPPKFVPPVPPKGVNPSGAQMSATAPVVRKAKGGLVKKSAKNKVRGSGAVLKPKTFKVY